MPTVLNHAKDIQDIALDDTRVKGIVTTIKKYRGRHDALIEVLHVAQDTFGYVPLDVMRFISRQMKITPSKIYGVVTFYHFFSLKPKGENNCVVCTGTACHVKGAEGLLRQIESHYHVKPGHTTEDGRLGLQTARCIGCCGLAPVVVINEDIYAKATPDDIVLHVEEKMGAAQSG